MSEFLPAKSGETIKVENAWPQPPVRESGPVPGRVGLGSVRWRMAGGRTRHVGDLHVDGVEALYDGGPKRGL